MLRRCYSDAVLAQPNFLLRHGLADPCNSKTVRVPMTGSVKAYGKISNRGDNDAIEEGVEGPPKGHALTVLTRKCEEYRRAVSEYEKEIMRYKARLKKAQDDALVLQDLLEKRSSRISTLLKREASVKTSAELIQEMEHVIQQELRRRMKAESECEELQQKLEEEEKRYGRLHVSIESRNHMKLLQDQMILEQKETISKLEEKIRNLSFDVDDFKVTGIKANRYNELLAESIATLTKEKARLQKVETQYAEENSLLKRKVKELANANQEITADYETLKKSLDIKATDFEDVSAELSHLKASYQTVLKGKKQLQHDYNSAIKQKQDLIEKNRATEVLITRKEKDISDLLTKVNETIRDYEAKLERKEEQMWAMAALSEEKQRNQNSMDPEILHDMEEKFSAKERSFLGEIERLNKTSSSQQERISVLTGQIEELNVLRYEPRMERLQMIEKDVRNRMEEYSVAEESLESGFLCPRCVQIYNQPHTLVPCGCTYCKKCLEDMREETYEQLRCQKCDDTPVDNVFRNETVESICERFKRRKTLVICFLEWLKVFRSYLPDDR